MGNFCSSRSDPDESRQQYEKYTFLRQQILGKLSDEVLANECGHLYAEECRRRRVTSLSKATWEEVGLPFIMRVSCNDPQTQHRIWQAVEEVYPGPPERPVNQATFVEFHRLALTLAEQDLRQRIAKVKEKYGGVAPPIPNSDWMSELFGKEPETDLEPLQISPRAQITESAVPLPSKTLEDTLQSHCNTAGSLQSRPLTSLPAVPVATGGSTPSPRLSPRPSMQSSPRFHGDDTLGSRMTLSSADCEAVGSQISYVLKEPRMDMEPRGSLRDSRASLTSETLSSIDRRVRDQEQVIEMRHLILNGQLDVMVFNKRLQPEARKLGLIQHTRRMQILREDGSCEDSWDVDHLQCISFGIASSILPQPPPAEKTLSFRFHFQKYGSEARYLCAMFADGTNCRLAAAAFSQLCGVPVTTSEPFTS